MKEELRNNLRKRISLIDLESKKSFDQEIFNKVDTLIPHHFKNKLGLYIPLVDEPDWKELNVKWGDVCFPVITKLGLEFWTLKKKAKYKSWILSKDELQEKKEVEVLVIPGLGFTKDGYRLGRGGGHYDRFLKSFQGTKIGVCYEECFVDFKHEEHDERVDFIVSEAKIIKV